MFLAIRAKPVVLWAHAISSCQWTRDALLTLAALWSLVWKRFILVSLQSDYRTIEVSTIVYTSADLIYKVVESVLFKAHVPSSNPWKWVKDVSQILDLCWLYSNLSLAHKAALELQCVPNVWNNFSYSLRFTSNISRRNYRVWQLLLPF